MAKFTAKRLMEVCESQNGTVGGYKYWNYFGQPGRANEDWCCVSGCYCLAEAGSNIGCWPNCGRVEADGGIQAGMLKAGFKKCSSISEAGKGACVIINHHNDSYYIYDHFVIWCGTYSYQNGVYGIDVWNGNASNTFKKSWYPLSHIEAVYMPNFDGEEPAATGKIAVDGIVGTQTVTRWQKWLGVAQTGSFAGQNRGYQAYLPAVTAISWGGGGCAAVKAIQKIVGATQDGLMGPQTVRLLQSWMNKHCKSGLAVDGKLGTQTAKAIQKALNSKLG